MKNNKMCKSAGVLYRISGLALVLGWVAVFLVVCACFNMVSSMGSLRATYLVDGIVGGVGISLKNPKVVDEGLWRGMMLMNTFACLLLVAIYLYMVFQVRKILYPMKQGRPFEKGISKVFFQTGWVILGSGVIINGICMANRYLIAKMVSVKDLFDMRNVLSVDWTYSFDFGFVCVAVVIFILAFIFRYGEELQQEADETL